MKSRTVAETNWRAQLGRDRIAGPGLALRQTRFCVRCQADKPPAGGSFHAGTFTCGTCKGPAKA